MVSADFEKKFFFMFISSFETIIKILGYFVNNFYCFRCARILIEFFIIFVFYWNWSGFHFEFHICDERSSTFYIAVIRYSEVSIIKLALIDFNLIIKSLSSYCFVFKFVSFVSRKSIRLCGEKEKKSFRFSFK